MKDNLEEAFKTAFEKGRSLSNFPLDIRVIVFNEFGGCNVDSYILIKGSS